MKKCVSTRTALESDSSPTWSFIMGGGSGKRSVMRTSTQRGNDMTYKSLACCSLALVATVLSAPALAQDCCQNPFGQPGCVDTAGNTNFPGLPTDFDQFLCEVELLGDFFSDATCDPDSGICMGAMGEPLCGNTVVEEGEQCDPPNGVNCALDCRIFSVVYFGGIVQEPGQIDAIIALGPGVDEIVTIPTTPWGR